MLLQIIYKSFKKETIYVGTLSYGDNVSFLLSALNQYVECCAFDNLKE